MSPFLGQKGGVHVPFFGARIPLNQPIYGRMAPTLAARRVDLALLFQKIRKPADCSRMNPNFGRQRFVCGEEFPSISVNPLAYDVGELEGLAFKGIVRLNPIKPTEATSGAVGALHHRTPRLAKCEL